MKLSDMQKKLTTKTLGRNVFLLESVDSTSTYLRKNSGFMKDGHTVIALEQHSGRGRTGKNFYSPKHDGLYFSFLLKDPRYTLDPLFTEKISFALCKAIDKITQTEEVKIKWVNDIFFSGKKLAGILCEAITRDDTKQVIVGIGVNITVDKGALPKDLKNKVCSLNDIKKAKYDALTLAALILNELESLYDLCLESKDFISEYKKRSVVLGKEIYVHKGEEKLRAAALDISQNGGLIVRYESGIAETLDGGEISISAI